MEFLLPTLLPLKLYKYIGISAEKLFLQIFGSSPNQDFIYSIVQYIMSKGQFCVLHTCIVASCSYASSLFVNYWMSGIAFRKYFCIFYQPRRCQGVGGRWKTLILQKGVNPKAVSNFSTVGVLLSFLVFSFINNGLSIVRCNVYLKSTSLLSLPVLLPQSTKYLV